MFETKLMDAAKVDKQINSYLSSLNIEQKKAVLTVVKTFASSQQSTEYSDDFKKELDSRYEEFINGGELLTEEEVNNKVEEIIKGSKKK